MKLAVGFLLWACAVAAAAGAPKPTAKTLNGTYEGLHLPTWGQDAFLGIPFAQPPVGNLRFRWPQSLNTAFDQVRNATAYGNTCMQHSSTAGFPSKIDEDCLNLNIVRPSTQTGHPLPVLVWIYGGGLVSGSNSDPQYNLSGIVRTAQEVGQPILAVSINYRLGLWGFLQSTQLLAEGSANAGLLDQRMALRWIQENVAAFGGDPKRVTIWGESAGAQSIGLHLHSYDGRHDGLFSAAIMESGGPTGTNLSPLTYYLAPFENLTRTVGCWTASDQLSCMRALPASTLFDANPSQVWNPIVDGDFLTAYPSDLTPQGKFVKVPLITGANTDEGTSFSIRGLDNATALFDALLVWRQYALSPASIRRLFALYPDDASTPKPPYAVPPSVSFDEFGTQWRRSAALGGDLVMHAQRRKMAEAYTKAGQPVFSYRFDTPLWNAAPSTGANHFCNVVFMFQNISGALGPLPAFESYKTLSFGIGRAYANFAATRDPNGKGMPALGASLPRWPKYSLARPTNMVLNSNGSFVEADTWRRDGMAFLNTHAVDRELLA
ncbi:lipase [Exidia glandulosa HHB12029]|uniref:Carboxylic ester hydrolase n=1 Tax=Exidia glandulosa HHB12029 TaxID=1314781 RepID=A0A165PU90_EXIGL|nr:lipase [Exidia glandulosa HHB12029]